MQLVLKSVFAAAVLATLTYAAQAQPMGMEHHPMGGPGAFEHPCGKGMHGPMDPAKMQAMAARRAADLKARLKLGAEQEGAWNTFIAAMMPTPRKAENCPDRAELDKLSTPERIDRMHALRTQRMGEWNAALDKREETAKVFYATLNAEQKKVFDAEHARIAARRAEHHGHGPAAGADKPVNK
ncbi:MAG: Spy/CpxP family protein refolding chaperone [Rhodoferax sp.]